MSKQKKLIRDDINFLEFPSWVSSKKRNITVYTIQKEHGKYEIISSLGLPKHPDKIVIYFLLHKLYSENSFRTCTLATTRYEIAKGISDGNRPGKQVYDRIMVALKRWKAIFIYFEGVFFDDSGYSRRGFSIIDEFVLNEETGKLTIRFNDTYIRQLKETTFCKMIDFEQYKRLRKTISARLYEILVKNFKERSCWSIGLQNLAEKLTFEKRADAKNYYASDVLGYIRSGVNEINKKTELSMNFEYDKDNAVCTFKKIKIQKEKFVPAKEVRKQKKKEDESAKLISYYLQKFEEMPIEEQEETMRLIAMDPFLPTLDRELQIYIFLARVDKQMAKYYKDLEREDLA